MEREEEKLEKIISLLRENRPVISGQEDFVREVIDKASPMRKRINIPELVYEFLFGWVWLGWMRRSMVIATVSVIAIFIVQQVIIIGKLNSMAGKEKISGVVFSSGSRNPAARPAIVRFFSPGNRAGYYPSDSEIERFIRSVDRVKSEYSDLFELMERDPELKKYIEQRLASGNLNKSKNNENEIR